MKFNLFPSLSLPTWPHPIDSAQTHHDFYYLFPSPHSPPPISAPGKLPSVAIALSYKADLQSSWWGLFQLFIMDVAIVADHNSLYTLTCVAELFYSCHGSEYCVFLLVVFKIPSRSLGKFLLFHTGTLHVFLYCCWLWC